MHTQAEDSDGKETRTNRHNDTTFRKADGSSNKVISILCASECD